ncbi:MAG: type I-C CRISPR-associated protein Cas8c/Csd1, partial [Ignavibacteria bacterium]|nr:type I-C CRISPR-associated protein Cas8c/Csd1 [Ignavibacteria bacterium]
MIKELAEFGKRIRTGHDALKDESISIDLIINPDGSFNSFSVIEKISRPAEALNSKKGKARLLLDKAEEVLNYAGFSPDILDEEKTTEQKKAQNATLFKHQLFLAKLNLFKELEILAPVFSFYHTNKINGLDKAIHAFEVQVGEKERAGNIAFRMDQLRLHEQKVVYDSLIQYFEKEQSAQLNGHKKICSVCGKTDFPVLNQTHGMIKRVPDGQTAGCALVSYNEKAFESYELKGNDNSSICTNCAKNYVEGLNWLLANGS